MLGEGKDRAHLTHGRRLAGQQTLSSPSQMLPLARPSPCSASPADTERGFTPTSHLLPMCCGRAELAGAVVPGFPCLETRGGESRAGARRGAPPEPPPASSQRASQSQEERHPQGLHTVPSWTLLQPRRFLLGLSTSSRGFLAEGKGGWHCPRGHVRAGGCRVRLGLRGEEPAQPHPSHLVLSCF